MAIVNGRPFISYVIDYYQLQGVEQFIFSLGYKHEIIENYLESEYSSLDYKIVIENEPLGTGGAVQLALEKTNSENILILNGDTLFKVDLSELSDLHYNKRSECTLALKPMIQFDRYGVVVLNKDFRVTSFKEKQYYKTGNINGGVYILNKSAYLKHQMPPKYSFEKEYLEAFISQSLIYGCVQDGYFIDIGIPEDYAKAQSDLKK